MYLFEVVRKCFETVENMGQGFCLASCVNVPKKLLEYSKTWVLEILCAESCNKAYLKHVLIRMRPHLLCDLEGGRNSLSAIIENQTGACLQKPVVASTTVNLRSEVYWKAQSS